MLPHKNSSTPYYSSAIINRLWREKELEYTYEIMSGVQDGNTVTPTEQELEGIRPNQAITGSTKPTQNPSRQKARPEPLVRGSCGWQQLTRLGSASSWRKSKEKTGALAATYADFWRQIIKLIIIQEEARTFNAHLCYTLKSGNDNKLFCK